MFYHGRARDGREGEERAGKGMVGGVGQGEEARKARREVVGRLLKNKSQLQSNNGILGSPGWLSWESM